MNLNHIIGNEKKGTLQSRQKTVERVITTISEKLDEQYSLSDMAHIAYLSPFHFNRIFHQITGLPPSQFLYALRLEQAKRLLLTTEMSVTDICFEVGYNSLGTFTSRFTELVGLSPRDYRRLGEKIRSFDWEKLFREGWKTRSDCPTKPFLSGTIYAPEGFEGLIFTGLFQQMIPQNFPVAGTLMVHSGSFVIDSLPDGEFHLLSAALPHSKDAIKYLLPDFSEILVGVSETTISITSKRNIKDLEIYLRPFEITDPPILLALPNLLVNSLTSLSS
ncbi:MAG: AraC family transcriptional regulator [Pyrinomonadaceae bacterium]|nr:AraC family transcriptional regulator [Pyrinomonadaceae bacterium]